jgi:peptide/nickel transport system substrate-binding protein
MQDRENNKHNPMMTRRSALLGGGCLVTAAAGPLISMFPRRAAAQSAAGQAVIGNSQEVTVLHPLMGAIGVDQGVHWNLYDTLWQLDVKGNFVPLLAKQVPTIENGGISEDGINWRVELRDDVRWHDGKPLTAADVKYSIELVQNPKFRARNRNGYELVSDISVEGDRVITWKMSKSFSPLLSLLSWTFIVPSHILADLPDPNAPEFAASPVGTGPFRFVERKAGDYVMLEANPDYYGEGPYLKRLVFKYIPDMNSLYTQFKVGGIDCIGEQGVPANFYKEAKALPNRSVGVSSSAQIENIVFNLQHPALSDLAVRKALYMAVDKQSVVDLVYYGVPKPAETYMPLGHWARSANIAPHEYNLDKAKALLNEAGWIAGSDGIRVKDGVRLSFSNSTTSGNPLREQTQQLLADDFRKIGAEMVIKNMPAAVIWGDFWKYSKFDSLMSSTPYLLASDPDVQHRFGSRYIPKETGAGSNVAQYKNPEVDQLLERGVRENSIDKRKVIYARIQELIRDELPIMPLFHTAYVEGTKSDLQGFAANVNVLSSSWNASTWRWKS